MSPTDAANLATAWVSAAVVSTLPPFPHPRPPQLLSDPCHRSLLKRTGANFDNLSTPTSLSSVLAQANTIRNQLDPFSHARGEDHFGSWGLRQRRLPWYDLTRPPLDGPIIKADLQKCLGLNILHLSRRPICRVGVPS